MKTQQEIEKALEQEIKCRKAMDTTNYQEMDNMKGRINILRWVLN